MKINEMSKEELLNHMRFSRELYRYDEKTPSWQRAFELARANGLENVDHGCQKCIQKVLEWLER